LLLERHRGSQVPGRGENTIAFGTNRLAAIRDLLERDPVSLEIVRYLASHSEAADTARGVADWWIKRDLPSTVRALTKLVDHGVVCAYAVQDETLVFGYTKNTLLRQTLARHVLGWRPVPPLSRA